MQFNVRVSDVDTTHNLMAQAIKAYQQGFNDRQMGREPYQALVLAVQPKVVSLAYRRGYKDGSPKCSK